MAARKKKQLTPYEGVERLLQSDHAFLSDEGAFDIAGAFSITDKPPIAREVDTRQVFKGLTVNRPSGFLTHDEYKAWVAENWYWLKPERGELRTKPKYVEALWSAYTSPEPDGLGLEGVPYAEGIDATDLACWCCEKLGLDFAYYHGRGFQLRECARVIAQHFELDLKKEV